MMQEVSLNPNRIQEYRESPALNQSSLKLLMKDPKLVKAVQEESDKKYFTIGSAVDIFITEGVEAFYEQYYVSDMEKEPSDAIKAVWQFYLEAKSPDLSLLDACNEIGYGQSYKPETRVKKVEEHEYYYNMLRESEGKTILSVDDFALVSRITNSLKNHDFTSQYINPAGEGWEVRGQVPIYFLFHEVDCKALLDLVLINHKDKTIRGVDIKTMSGNTTTFIYQMRKFRYDIQGAWYGDALISFRNRNFPDYEVEPFAFVVESTTNPGYPIVKEMSKHDVTNAINGVERVVTYTPNVQKTENIWGISEALDRYKWHEYYDKWEYPKELYETNGEIIENIWW